MESWNARCEKSIREQRKEVEQRYGIKIGQTTITCARCGSQCWPGQHTCQDLALIKAREVKSEKAAQVETDKLTKKENLLQLRKSQTNLMAEIQHFGIKKMSTLLMLPKNTVNKWIQRGKVPDSRLEKALETLRGV